MYSHLGRIRAKRLSFGESLMDIRCPKISADDRTYTC